MNDSTDPQNHRGSARTTTVVMCCPACTSLDVLLTHREAGRAVAWWSCRTCGGRWKEVAAVGRGRASLP